MNKLSLRTKGLIFIVLTSFIPLLIAGIGNYSAVKQAMIKSEEEKTSSNLSIKANNLSSWMAVRRAEVLVMSRTDVVRFGTEENRLSYFERELVRSDYTYYSIGYIDKYGNGIRSDGDRRDMRNVPLFEEAIKGRIVITDPNTPMFSDIPQSLIVVPVYGFTNEVIGVVYASILYSTLMPYIENTDSSYTLQLVNDDGRVMYSSAWGEATRYMLTDDDSLMSPIADQILTNNQGMARLSDNRERHVVFYSKVDSVPWRFVLQEPASNLEVELEPIFWRNLITITISELIIVLFFSLYFDRIINRLERILSVTEQAAKGNLDADHLDESIGDEIGKLAGSVNGMMVQLQETFDQLSAVINQNQYAFIVLDDQYKVTYMNRMAEQLLGYRKEELVGHATPLLFMDLDQIKEKAEMLSAKLGREVLPGLDVFRELRDENFSYETEWMIVRKDGTRVPTQYSSNGLRDRNGRFAGVVVMINDITDRKRVENARNRLLNIVDSAKDLIASADVKGNIIYFNQSGRDMLGLYEENGQGNRVEEYMTPEMYVEMVKGAAYAVKHGYWESEMQFKRTDGKMVDVSVIVVVHHDEVSGELFYSTIARDITEQKLVREELVRARQEAEEASEAKGRFLALMSHEIRTPLNGIIGLTHLMLKSGLLPSQKDYMDKISTSSESLLRIINDVLDFSKMEAGKINVERHPFQPELLHQRLSDQISVFLGGKEQFEFIIDTPASPPQTVMGDALRLEQVLLNLCINAVKFTTKGVVRLKIELAKQQNELAYYTFTVSDTGIGMSEEQLDRLFKPFTQADGSTTRKFGGTGLGLVISKTLVELMGGRLEVESRLGVGSRFFFTLPFHVIQRNQEQPWRVEQSMLGQPIWIIEDNEEMRSHWVMHAERLGLTAIEFDSWKQANEKLQRTGQGAMPVIILADMEMPDMYGMDTWLELQHHAKEDGVKTIAMTTTYGRDEMLRLPEQDRPYTILIKPITAMSMQQALRRALENEQPEQAILESDFSDFMEVEPDSDGVRILLAEDNNINQIVAIEMLKELGYEVGLAENGEQLLCMLEERRWHLILMDIHMPVMDGSEATKIIRSKPQYDSIPIIAVTANTLKHDHEKYLKLGISAVITKPIDPLQLRAAIEGALMQMRQLGAGARAKEEIMPPQQAIERKAEEQLELGDAIMDVPAALMRVKGRKNILIHMLEQFHNDYSSFMELLQSALDRGESGTAARMLHTLKGAAGYLSAYRVMTTAAEAEAALKQKAGGKELSEAINSLKTEMLSLLEEIPNILQTFDNIS